MKEKVNVQNHSFVPKFTKLSEKDKEQLLAKYNVSIRQLPFILISDPAIQDMDLKEGDILKIIRESSTADQAIYYRVVVHG